MRILRAVGGKLLSVSMLNPRNHLMKLCWTPLLQQSIATLLFQPLQTALELTAVQMSRRHRIMTNRPPSVHSPEYDSQHQIFVFLLILLIPNNLASSRMRVNFLALRSSRKYLCIPDRYLQKTITEREMFQSWAASSPPNTSLGCTDSMLCSTGTWEPQSSSQDQNRFTCLTPDFHLGLFALTVM